MNWNEQQECQQDIHRIQVLLQTGVLDPPKSKDPLRESAFIELMICLRDLMEKARIFGAWQPFTEDVLQTAKVKNVADLIRDV